MQLISNKTISMEKMHFSPIPGYYKHVLKQDKNTYSKASISCRQGGDSSGLVLLFPNPKVNLQTNATACSSGTLREHDFLILYLLLYSITIQLL